METLDPKILGQRLEALRKANNLTQHDLAREMKIAQGAISNYEQGLRLPNTKAMMRFVEFFGVTLQELLSITPNYENSKREFTITLINNKLKSFTQDDLDLIHALCARFAKDYK